jgi:hypothetical protein
VLAAHTPACSDALTPANDTESTHKQLPYPPLAAMLAGRHGQPCQHSPGSVPLSGAGLLSSQAVSEVGELSYESYVQAGHTPEPLSMVETVFGGLLRSDVCCRCGCAVLCCAAFVGGGGGEVLLVHLSACTLHLFRLALST